MSTGNDPVTSSQLSLLDLPEGCLYRIFSFFSPQELCQASLLCKTLFALAFSDTIWAEFLPRDYREQAIRPQVDEPAGADNVATTIWSKCLPDGSYENQSGHPAQGPPLAYSTFLQASIPPGLQVAGQEQQCIWVDRKSGRQGGLGTPQMWNVTWGGDDCYWRWGDVDGAWFKPCGILRAVCWLEAHGTLRCTLPPGRYTASWRLGAEQYMNGFSSPIIFSATVRPSGQTVEVEAVLDELFRRDTSGVRAVGRRSRRRGRRVQLFEAPMPLPPVQVQGVRLGVGEINVVMDDLEMMDEENEDVRFGVVEIGEVIIEEGWDNMEVDFRLFNGSPYWKHGLVVDCFCLLPRE